VIQWQYSSFDDLSRDTLFEILKVRQAIFVVEQNCAYQDVDDLDPVSWHLMGWRISSGTKELAAYLRISLPGEKYSEPSIGRVLTAPSFRGTGIGKALMHEGITRTSIEYPGAGIRISAQLYLEKFYSEFGFKKVSAPYDEDGIPHIEMLRAP
jgi:ElaA protein